MMIVTEMPVAHCDANGDFTSHPGGRVREEDLQLAVRKDGHGLPDERGGTVILLS